MRTSLFDEEECPLLSFRNVSLPPVPAKAGDSRAPSESLRHIVTPTSLPCHRYLTPLNNGHWAISLNSYKWAFPGPRRVLCNTTRQSVSDAVQVVFCLLQSTRRMRFRGCSPTSSPMPAHPLLVEFTSHRPIRLVGTHASQPMTFSSVSTQDKSTLADPIRTHVGLIVALQKL
jgi:hypothetical protein